MKQYINIKSVKLALRAYKAIKKDPFTILRDYKYAKSTDAPSPRNYNSYK